MEVAVGKFVPNLTASQVVPGLGMSAPPQLIWFYGNSPSTGGAYVRSDLRPSFGQAINGQAGWGIAQTSRDARAASVEKRTNTILSDWIGQPNNAATISAAFNVITYAADSFTLDWTVVPTELFDIGFVAIGGLTNIYQSAQQITDAATSFLTGTQVDFAQNTTAAHVLVETAGIDSTFSWGGTSDGTTGQCIGFGARDNQGNTDCGRTLAPGASFANRSNSIIRSRATWNGWSAASVDTNWSVFRASQAVYFTGIEGGQWEVKSFGVVSGATQKITLPFAPKGVVLYANGNKTTDNHEVIHPTYTIGYGITDGTTQYGVFCANLNGEGDSTLSLVTDETRALVLYDPISTLATIEASVALDADGFTLTYDTVSAGVNDTEIIYVAFGDAGGPPPPKEGEANLNATATLVATGTAVKEGVAGLSATATLVATGTKVGAPEEGVASLSATATLVATGAAVKEGVASLNATATLVATGTAVKEGAASLSATATLAAIGIKEGAAVAFLNATATVVATGSKISPKEGVANLNATATVVADGSIISGGAADLLADAKVTATGTTIKSGSAQLLANATIAAMGQKQGEGLGQANLLATATVFATSAAPMAVKTLSYDILLNNKITYDLGM